jgi:hypothetical protein
VNRHAIFVALDAEVTEDLVALDGLGDGDGFICHRCNGGTIWRGLTDAACLSTGSQKSTGKWATVGVGSTIGKVATSPGLRQGLLLGKRE